MQLISYLQKSTDQAINFKTIPLVETLQFLRIFALLFLMFQGLGTWKTYWLHGEDPPMHEDLHPVDSTFDKKSDLQIMTFENETLTANNSAYLGVASSNLVSGLHSNRSSPRKERRISQRQRRISKANKEKRHRYGIVDPEIVVKKQEEGKKEKLEKTLSTINDSDSDVKVYITPKTNSRKVHFIKASDSPARSSVDSVREEPQSGRDSGIEVCFDNPEWMNANVEENDRL